MNRAEMNAYIRENAAPALRGELEHFMSIEEREYAYDEVCAALDVMDRSETALSDGLDKAGRRRARAELAAARSMLIAIGFYREMPPEEIESTFTSSGRAAYEFKLNGVAYTTDEIKDEWFDEAEENGERDQ